MFARAALFYAYQYTTFWRNMEAKSIIYGETALDELAQWLKSTGQPQNIEDVVRQYIAIMRQLVLEGEQ
jgi:hypothetical protein